MNKIPTNKYVELKIGEEIIQGFITHQGLFAKFIGVDKDGFKNYELIQIESENIEWKELE